MMQAQLDQNTSLPLLTKIRDGTPVQSPHIGIMNRAAALMTKGASELGFSPAARRRRAAGAQEPAQEQSSWSQLKVSKAARAQANRDTTAPQDVVEAVACAEAVMDDAIPAGRLAVLACARFLRDRAAAEAAEEPWAFRPDLVEAALLLAGQMPNIKARRPASRCD